MWKFKSLKGKDKWLFLLTMGVILCILAFPAEGIVEKKAAEETVVSEGVGGSEEIGAEDTVQTHAALTGSYEAILEKRIKELLSHAEGVGAVDVMIVLKSSAQKVVLMDGTISRSSTDETDGTISRKSSSEEEERTAVFHSADGTSSPVVEKELYPEISGMVISAEGGGDPKVRAEISAAMEALFGLPANKVKVLKRSS